MARFDVAVGQLIAHCSVGQARVYCYCCGYNTRVGVTVITINSVQLMFFVNRDVPYLLHYNTV